MLALVLGNPQLIDLIVSKLLACFRDINLQWGVGAPYSNGYSVTTLPIPFSNTDYTVIANSSWLNSGAVMASAALSVTQIKVRNEGYTDTYHFLTIGC